MNNDDLTQLKNLAGDLNAAFHAVGDVFERTVPRDNPDVYASAESAYLHVANVLNALEQFISRQEKDNQTPRPVIVFRRQDLDPTDHI
jgi:hypothetical protein